MKINPEIYIRAMGSGSKGRNHLWGKGKGGDISTILVSALSPSLPSMPHARNGLLIS